MLVLKIVSVLLGLSFTLFGYFIYLRKSIISSIVLKLISKQGEKNEEYAKRVGMVEFVIGIAVLVAGIVLIIFT